MFFQILRDTRDVVAQTDEQVQSSGQGSPIRLRLMSMNYERRDKSTFHEDNETNA